MLSELSSEQSWIEVARCLEEMEAESDAFNALMAASIAKDEMTVEDEAGRALMTISSLGRNEMSYDRPGVESKLAAQSVRNSSSVRPNRGLLNKNPL